jgi:(2Fe-2S) ferredoxin
MLNPKPSNMKPATADDFKSWQKLWFLLNPLPGKQQEAVGLVTRYSCCSHPGCIRGSAALKKALIREGRELGLDLDVTETPTICRGNCSKGPFIGLPEKRLFYFNVQASEAYDLIDETSLQGHVVFSKLLLDSTKVTDNRILFNEKEGLLVLIEPGYCLVEAVDYLFRFNAPESCGKCFPCRYGVHKLAGLLQKLRQGSAKKGELEVIRKTAAAMAQEAYCYFGAKVTAPLRLLMGQKPQELEKHLEKGCGGERLHLTEKERG